MNISNGQIIQSNIKQEYDLNDKYLRLTKKSIRKLITLPPKYLGNLNQGIEDAIFRSNQEIYKEFDGVPISIGKKTLLQNVGTSFDDHAFIQFYVDLDCVVFTPKVDKKVKAVVSKIGETYIGCLICDRIHATIFKRHNTKHSRENQVDEGQDFNLNSLQLNQNILIKINSISLKENDLFIVASFVKSLE